MSSIRENIITDKHLIAETRPVANVKNIVFWKNYRVTVLQRGLFRIEFNDEKKFRDDATQSVWYRDMPPQKFTVADTTEKAVITTDICRLILKDNRKDCRVILNGKSRKIDNIGNLKGTYRTLDCCDGDNHIDIWSKEQTKTKIQLGVGVCSRAGVAAFDDASSLTLGKDGLIKAETGAGSDEYVFVYGNNFRAAVKALYLITGEVPMIPRYVLGNWWSRYYAYTEREYLTLLNRFEEHNIPLTVATIDMDWHYSDFVDKEVGITASNRNTPFYGGNNGWTGYTWNKNLFPDYRNFLNKVGAKNLKITLNLHPADGVRWWEDCYKNMAQAMGKDASTGERIPFDITDPKFIDNYFSVIHKPYEKEGVTFWWIDWQQGTDSGLKGLDPLWSLNHYHYLDHAKNRKTPVILSRYAGIGSHRYPIGFSGDTLVTWKTLKYLPYFTLTASNIGYTWWSHDIGGHMAGTMSGELYVRHVQFGVLSPINRLHCSNFLTMTKEPWVYGNGTGEIAENWLRLRHRMIPFLYSCSYRVHKDGLALIEPLYYEWSEAKEAYLQKDEYIFGGQTIVAPVTNPMQNDGYARVKVWIPEGVWTDIFTGDEYNAPKGGITKTLLRNLESVPVLARSGAVLPLSCDKGNSIENPSEFEVSVFSGDGEFTLYEDGKENNKDGEFFTEFKTESKNSETEGLQILFISGKGDVSVIPKKRKFRIKFINIPQAEILLYADGNLITANEITADCAEAEFDFEQGKTYRMEARYGLRTSQQKLISRAKEVLLRAEGKHSDKSDLWRVISETKTLEEFLKAVDESKVGIAAKLRLKETL